MPCSLSTGGHGHIGAAALRIDRRVGLALLCTVLTACSRHPADSVDPKVMENLVESCVLNGPNRATCYCLMREILDKYTLQDLVAYGSGQRAPSKDYLADVTEAGGRCMRQHGL